MKKMLIVFLLAVTCLFFGVQRSEAGIPLLNIEGSGGGAIVPWAYIANPPKDGQQIGMPSAGAWFWTSSDYDFYFLNAAISPHKRVELGIAYANLDISELRSDLKADSLAALGAGLDGNEDDLSMIVAHVKLLLVEETDTLPAIAVSAEYKKSLNIEDMADDLTAGVRSIGGLSAAPGLLEWMGYDDDSGVDFNVMATKLWKNTPLPILTSLSIRATKANQTGFLGFSDDWKIQPEATVAVVARGDLIIGAEYRSKPDELNSVNEYLFTNAGGIRPTQLNKYSFEEDAFVDFFVVYLPPSIPGLTLAAGVANIGNIVHTDVNSIWAFNAKYDF